MDLRTGKMFNLLDGGLPELAKRLGHNDIVPLTEKEAEIFKPLSRRRRKFLMQGKPCPCGSGKSFKKCHWKKYKTV